MRLLRRKTTSFDIQVEDLTLHITAPDDYRGGVACAGAVVLGAAPVLRAAQPGVPASRSGRCAACAEDAPPIVREMVAASNDAGVGPMFTFRGAVTDQVGRFLAGSLSEVTVSCDGDYFIQTKKRMRLAVRRHGGEPIAVAVEPVRGGIGVSTTLGRGRGGGGPRRPGRAGDLVHAGRRRRRRRAGAPAEGGRLQAGACDTSSRCPASAAAWSSSGEQIGVAGGVEIAQS